MSKIRPWQDRIDVEDPSEIELAGYAEEEICELRTRVAELESAAKLALDALVATTPVPREYDEAYYRREWPKEFAALDALRKAGVK